MICDKLGTEIKEGSIIAYTTRNSEQIKVGRVKGFGREEFRWGGVDKVLVHGLKDSKPGYTYTKRVLVLIGDYYVQKVSQDSQTG